MTLPWFPIKIALKSNINHQPSWAHLGPWADTLRPSPGNHGLDIGKSSPFMAQQFRLVNYDNLPRHIVSRLSKVVYLF